MALKATDFFKAHPALETLEAFVIDVNGVPRGKLIPRSGFKKVIAGGLNIPLSAFAPDIWGNDVPENGLIRETGDSDGVCAIVPETLTTLPWQKNTAQALL